MIEYNNYYYNNNYNYNNKFLNNIHANYSSSNI